MAGAAPGDSIAGPLPRLSPGRPAGTWGLYSWCVAAIVARDAAGFRVGLATIAGALPRLSRGRRWTPWWFGVAAWGLYSWHVAAIVASDAAGRRGGLHLGDSIAGALPRLSPGTPLDIAVV